MHVATLPIIQWNICPIVDRSDWLFNHYSSFTLQNICFLSTIMEPCAIKPVSQSSSPNNVRPSVVGIVVSLEGRLCQSPIESSRDQGLFCWRGCWNTVSKPRKSVQSPTILSFCLLTYNFLTPLVQIYTEQLHRDSGAGFVCFFQFLWVLYWSIWCKA